MRNPSIRVLLHTVAVVALALAAGCTSERYSGGQCEFDADCRAGEVCAGGYCRATCRSDADCAAGTRCRAADSSRSLACVPPPAGTTGCTRDSECLAGQACLDGACRPQCVSDYDCQAINPLASCTSGRCTPRCEVGRGDCDGRLPNGCEVDLRSDVLNCSACGRACPAGQVCSMGACASACGDGETSCGGSCVRTESDAAHCGRCGNACPSGSQSEGRCEAGSCVLTCVDPSRYADCDGAASNGCEAELPRDVTNCGACGTRCPGGVNATGACVERACRLQCAAGFGDCDALAANGCERDTRTDLAHCGACGAACVVPAGASATCAAGACGFTCDAGYADCDADPSNGCEVDTRADGAHCGACGRRCGAEEVCSAGACRFTCAASETNCSRSCVTLATSLAHCGACDRACPAVSNAASTCAAGACGFACNAGFGDCDGNTANGCETSLGAAAAHCGACGRACSLPNATASCAGGACAVAACNAGFGDCDGNAANGCETNLTTTTGHCGACGRACALAGATAACRVGACAVGACNTGFGDCDGAAPNGCETDLRVTAAHCGACGAACSLARATPACASGACAVAACEAGWGDCDRSPTSGCEVDLNTANAHCGACGRACAAGQVCSNGSCTSVCAAPTTFCAGRCVNLQTAAADCGACGNACPARANASVACARGACGFACSAGFGDCDGSAANGCETSLNTAAGHCGACGAACDATNGTPACAAGRCAIACAAGFGDCDGAVTNGCETNLRAAASHCGACGRACSLANATPACAAGACAVSRCNAGFGDCDGAAANGCETNTNAAPAHCGMCGAACNGTNGSPTCSTAACGITCSAGFGNCDGALANGCETNTGAAVAHCGACGAACAPANATPSCAGGACGIAACSANFGDCDGALANGCEANLLTSVAHCGACGRACAAGFVCNAGACLRDCGALALCGGTCVNLQTNVSHCGACGRACSLANATPSCASGACAISRCDAGFGDCDGTLANGCETNTASSLAHCGACGRPCSFANAGASCVTSTCRLGACNAGFGNCDGVASNGCEANLQTNVAHCGACGAACVAPTNGAASCAAGRCRQSCDPGYYAIALGSGILCAPLPPARQVAPSSFSWSTARRPVFRWVVGGPIDGARLQVCTTRACTTTVLDVTVAGATYTPTADLPVGRLFWRLFGVSGTNTGATASPVWQTRVSSRSAARSASFGVTPDFNGDGFADFAVSDDYASAPTVRVFNGTPTGMSSSASTSLVGPTGSAFGFSVSPAGDVNGDGYGDLVVGAPNLYTAYVYLGSASGLGTRLTLSGPVRSGFGGAASWAGDTNDDGYGDVIVGACHTSLCEGAAYVYPGTSSGVSTTPRRLTAPGATGFGRYVQGAGELNNDALDDVIVGSAGAVYQFLGAATTPNLTLTHTGLQDVDFAWDVNGDGYGDVATVTSALSTSPTATLRVYPGGSNGLGAAPTTVGTPTRSEPFVAGLGDTNSDGFAEIAWSLRATSVRVYRGASTGLATTPSVTIVPSGGDGDYGWALWGTGDLNGDGRWDLNIESTNDPPCRRVIRSHLAGTSGISTAVTTTIYLSLICFG